MTEPSRTFAYTAFTRENQPIRGTLDATDVEAARRQLDAMGLRIELITATLPPPRTGPLRGEDFLAFNEQLSHLTTAGLPVERGLRLIADDMRRGSLRATVNAVADEVERGQSLSDAIDRHRANFPPLYATLVDAGVRTGNLPGMLLNLGRHVALVERLKQALWRALSYPLAVFIGVLLVSLFLGGWVLPQMRALSSDHWLRPSRRTMFGRTPPSDPWFADVALDIAAAVPIALSIIALAIFIFVLIWFVARAMRTDGKLMDSIGLRIPLIGPALRNNLVARWCDAAALGVRGGMDLPRAFDLAADSIRSSRLRADTQRLSDALARGQSLSAAGPLSILPATVPATIDLATHGGSLQSALDSLSQLYRQQAETRLAALPLILTPLLLALLALVIVFTLLGIMLPLVRMFQWIA